MITALLVFGAIIIATSGRSGWGWFIFAAVLIAPN